MDSPSIDSTRRTPPDPLPASLSAGKPGQPDWPAPPRPRSFVSIRGRLFYTWMIALAALYLLLVVALMAGNMAYMFQRSAEAHPGSGWWANFRDALGQLWNSVSSDNVRFAIKLSLLTSAVTVLLAILIGLPAGYLLARHRFPGVVLIDTLLDIPIVLPPLVVGVSLLIFFNTDMGVRINRNAWPVLEVINTLLMWLQTGLKWLLKLLFIDYQPIDLGSDGLVFSPWGIVLAQFIVACAFGVRMIKTTFEQIDPRLEAVARTLGASRGQAFFRVALPTARNGILAAAVVTWARAIGEFGPILIFCGTTRGRTEVLPTSIYLEFSIGNLTGALAVSMMMVAMAMLMLLVFKKLGGKF